MTEKKKKSNQKALREKDKKGTSNTSQKESDQEEFDFGGFPKGVSLKRNIGCGG